ncbi:unnamed protein product [Calypogeia fissa]
MSTLCLQGSFCCHPQLVLNSVSTSARVPPQSRIRVSTLRDDLQETAENGNSTTRRTGVESALGYVQNFAKCLRQGENRLSSPFKNLQGLSWSCGSLLNSGPTTNQNVLVANARRKNASDYSTSSGGGNNEELNPPEKEMSIPPALYRPLSFPDLQKAVRGLNPGKRWIYGMPFLAVLAAVAWFRNIGVAGLVDDGEPLFVEAARQMIVTGDYFTPQFNGVPLFDKPVLSYWLIAISVKLFGSAAWAFRLPSCLCATGLLMGLFLTVNHFGIHLSPDMEIKANNMQLSFGDRFFLPAIVTAASFAISLQVVTWGSAALSDMLFTSTIGASLLSFFWAYAGRAHKPAKYSLGYVLAAVFAGLACLTKGPLGIVFPTCVCAGFLLSTGELKTVFMDELPKVKGVFIVLLMNLPWYGMMFLRHGSVFLSTFFGHHSFERYVRDGNHYGGQLWVYGVAIVLVTYFPWSLSLPSALAETNPWKHRYSWREYPRTKRLSLFAAVWLFAGFVIVALSAIQLPSYYLPIAPAVALLAASHLSLPVGCHSSRLAAGLVPALLYQILAGLFYLLPGLLASSSSSTIADIGNEISNRYLHLIGFGALAVAGTLATRTEEYATAYCPDLQLAKAESSSRKTFVPLWVLHTAAMVTITSAFTTPCFHLVDKVRQFPIRQLALMAAEVQQPGEALIMVGEKMPSVVFYSQLQTTFVDTSVEADKVLQENPSNVPSALVISNEVWKGSLTPVILAQEQNFSLMRVVTPTADVHTE